MVPISLTSWFMRVRLLVALGLIGVATFLSWEVDRVQLRGLQARSEISETFLRVMATFTEGTLDMNAVRLAPGPAQAEAHKRDLAMIALDLRRAIVDIETGLRSGILAEKTQRLLTTNIVDPVGTIDDFAHAAAKVAADPDLWGRAMAPEMVSAQTAAQEIIPLIREIIALEKRELARELAMHRTWRTINLGIVVLLVLAIWAFIFRPLERNVQQTERDIRRKMDEAKEALKSKSEFLAMMSHEVRTPMNGVLGLTDQLAQSDLDPDQREIVRELADSGDAVMTILGDVLDISRIETGRLTLEPRRTDLRALAGTVQTMYRAEAERRGLDLSIHVAPDLAPFHLVDPGRLRQILANLVGNAVKFTEAGHVRLAVTAEEGGEGRQGLLFEVSDTGIGISPEDMERIFGAFEQADGSTTREYGGTGLGLAICNRVSAALGGRLSVESEKGRGSCFSLRLTLPTAGAAPDEEAVRQDAAWDFSDLRLLVAEDNRVNRKLLGRLLHNAGCVPVFAEDGAVAVEAAAAARFDLVLMDVAMPNLDGCDATRAILERDRRAGRAETPVVALTAHVDEGQRARCLESGMLEVLSKPFQAQKIFRAIDRHALGRQHRAGDTAA